MRNSILTTFIFFVAFTMLGQQPNAVAFNNTSIKNVFETAGKAVPSTKTKAMNQGYLNRISKVRDPQAIRQMQRKAASHSIASDDIFDDSEKATYLLVFKNERNKLVARYSEQGEILSTLERYRNIALPVSLKVKLAKKHPGWSFGKNSCLISYELQHGIHRTYKVQLKKGHKRKTLTIKQ